VLTVGGEAVGDMRRRDEGAAEKKSGLSSSGKVTSFFMCQTSRGRSQHVITAMTSDRVAASVEE
jgi:hypothetical protein